MSKRCCIMQKNIMSGNNVSHAKNKTRRKFFFNIQNASLPSEILKTSVKLRISTRTIRTIEHKGGIDSFLSSMPCVKLPSKMIKLKKIIKKHLILQKVTQNTVSK